MKNKRADQFVEAYTKIEHLCTDKFGVKDAGGFATYIDRLTNAKYAPDREAVLEKLNAFKELKAKIDTDPTAVEDKNLVSKEDVEWISGFADSLKAKKDSLSTYLKKARSYAKRHKAAKTLKAILIVLAILLVLGIAGYACYLIDPKLFGLVDLLENLG